MEMGGNLSLTNAALGSSPASRESTASQRPQHFMQFSPLPHGHGSFRLTCRSTSPTRTIHSSAMLAFRAYQGLRQQVLATKYAKSKGRTGESAPADGIGGDVGWPRCRGQNRSRR